MPMFKIKFIFLAVAHSLRPLIGKNLSLTVREEFEGDNGSLTRLIHVWVRDPQNSRSKQLRVKGVIRENEPPNTLVHFKLHTQDKLNKMSESQRMETNEASTLYKVVSKFLPPNTSPSDLVLRNMEDENESVPFIISFNSTNNSVDSIRNIELRTSSWLDYEKSPSFSLSLGEKEPINTKTQAFLLNMTVDVVNVNDNLPVFKSSDAIWRFPSNARRYMVIGTALAEDADGDEIIYEFVGGKKVAGSGCCVVVPKTGEIMLVEPPFVPTHITVVAR